jgi:hypothetical protein
MEKPIIQGLWIGQRLSTVERLSITSFLQNGYDYHLYVYTHVDNIPPGTMVKDANELVPKDRIFTYKGYRHKNASWRSKLRNFLYSGTKKYGKGSYAGFANYFRYVLLQRTGGWWCDTDIICLRPFPQNENYVFSATALQNNHYLVNNSVIKTPPGSELMARLVERTSKVRGEAPWGTTGPQLMTEMVYDINLEEYIHPAEDFQPIHYKQYQTVLEPDQPIPDAYSIHLWNEMWRREDLDKDAVYPATSIFEVLKRRYNV